MGAIPCYQIRGPFNPKGQILILPRLPAAAPIQPTQQNIIIAPKIAPASVGTNPVISGAKIGTNLIVPGSQTVTNLVAAGAKVGTNPAASDPNSGTNSVAAGTNIGTSSVVPGAQIDTQRILQVPVGTVSSTVNQPLALNIGTLAQKSVVVTTPSLNFANPRQPNMLTPAVGTQIRNSTPVTVPAAVTPIVATTVLPQQFATVTTANVQINKNSPPFSIISRTIDTTEASGELLKPSSVDSQSIKSTTRLSPEQSPSAVCIVTPDGKVKAVSPLDLISAEQKLETALNESRRKTVSWETPYLDQQTKAGIQVQTVTRASSNNKGNKGESERISAELRMLDPQERNIVELVRQLEAENEDQTSPGTGDVPKSDADVVANARPSEIGVLSVVSTSSEPSYRSPDLEIPTISFSMITESFEEDEQGGDVDDRRNDDDRKTRDVLLTTLLTPKTPKSGAYGYGLGLDLEEIFSQTNPQEL